MSAARFVAGAYERLLQGQTPNTLEALTSSAVPFFCKDVIRRLCAEARSIFTSQPSLIEIEGEDVTIVGDLHGSLFDLLRILKDGAFSPQGTDKYLFLGDYVDRGNFSLEIVTLLFALAVKFPGRFILLRGNHEFESVCSLYGFSAEIQEAYADLDVWREFVSVFAYLPFAALIDQQHLCVHGGISRLLHNLDDIRNIRRPVFDYDANFLVRDLVWADARSAMCYFLESSRIEGVSDFGGRALRDFLCKNNLKSLIRAHQYHSRGVLHEFKSMYTVFSASSYKGPDANPSGILLYSKETQELTPKLFRPWSRLGRHDIRFVPVREKTRVERSQSMRLGAALVLPKCVMMSPPKERRRTLGFIDLHFNTGCSRTMTQSKSSTLNERDLVPSRDLRQTQLNLLNFTS